MSTAFQSAIRHPKSARKRGFSLIELLVVIGLITVLISLLIPAVARVRRAAWNASTQAVLNKIQGAVERYYQDFNAYPGPLSNADLNTAFTITATSGANVVNQIPSAPTANGTVASFTSVTGTNNLVLGLLGGLTRNTTNNTIQFDPTAVGKGPQSLNATKPGITPAYIDTANLSSGRFVYDGTTSMNDSPIPSFVDTFPDVMPILYLRARPGSTSVASYAGTNPATGFAAVAQYDLRDAMGYTTVSFGGAGRLSGRTANTVPTGGSPRHGLSFIDLVGSMEKSPPTGKTYYFPYEFSSYMTNPAVANTPRAKDTYVLIAAGADRVFGTDDDITTFGPVKP